MREIPAKLKARLIDSNPIIVHLLGVCSLLAVTTKLSSAVVMGISLTFVLVISELVISLLRNQIPLRLRMIVELSIISTIVIIIDMFIKAFFFDISQQLSVYVNLIITNCIIMGRLESFALNNTPKESFFDAISTGSAYSFVLIIVAAIREMLGYGTLFDYQLFSDFAGNYLFALPSGGFIVIGCFIWFLNFVYSLNEGE